MEHNDLKEGMAAPEFMLMGSDGKEHRLSSYQGKKVILYFYPKDNTPGWTTEAESFKDNAETLAGLNTVVLGVSRDTLASHDKFINKLSLPFILLSDENEVVCNLYGVLKDKNMYGKKVMGVERSTFIISENGIIQKIYRKVKVDGHLDDIVITLMES
jgi:thioredoxin-dependent peroxiredoxin